MNYEYRVVVNDSEFKIDESYEVERLNNESDNEYKKRAFKEYHKSRIELADSFEWFELRQYDLDEDDYIEEWDMTESKYYNGG
jgi:hypothetical protein